MCNVLASKHCQITCREERHHIFRPIASTGAEANLIQAQCTCHHNMNFYIERLVTKDAKYERSVKRRPNRYGGRIVYNDAR